MESEASKQAMILATLMDLGSARANHIRTVQVERHREADAEYLTFSRKTNLSGTKEAMWAAQTANSKALTSWNSFAITANPEAGLDDGTAGQSHRKRMVEALQAAPPSRQHGTSSRGGHSGRGSRGGGSSGRGLGRGGRKTVVGGQEFPKGSPGGRKICGTARSAAQDEQLARLFSTLKLGHHKVELPKSRMAALKGAFPIKKSSPKPKTIQTAAPRPAIKPPNPLAGSSEFVESYRKTSGLGMKSSSSQNISSSGSDQPCTMPVHIRFDQSENMAPAETVPSGKTFKQEAAKTVIRGPKSTEEIVAATKADPMAPTTSTGSIANISAAGLAPRPMIRPSSVAASSSVASQDSTSGIELEKVSPVAHDTMETAIRSVFRYPTLQEIGASVGRHRQMTRSMTGQDSKDSAFDSGASYIPFSPGLSSVSSTPARAFTGLASSLHAPGNIGKDLAETNPVLRTIAGKLGRGSESPSDVATKHFKAVKSPEASTNDTPVATNTGFDSGSWSDTPTKSIKAAEGPASPVSTSDNVSNSIVDSTTHATAGIKQRSSPVVKRARRPTAASLALLEAVKEIQRSEKEATEIENKKSAFTSIQDNTSKQAALEFRDPQKPVPLATPTRQDISTQTASEPRVAESTVARPRVSFAMPQKEKKSMRPVPAGLAFLNTNEDKMDVEQGSEARSPVSEMSLVYTMVNTSGRGGLESYSSVPGLASASTSLAGNTMSNFSAINKSLVQGTSSASRATRPRSRGGINASIHDPANMPHRADPFSKRFRGYESDRPVPAGLKFIIAANAEYDEAKIAKETSNLPDLDELPMSSDVAANYSSAFQHVPRWLWPRPDETYDEVVARIAQEYGHDQDADMEDDEDEIL